MPKQLPGPVAAAVGTRIKELRGNTSGAWIAREANELANLNWSDTTVNRIEMGRRGLTGEELIALPAILTAATGRTTTLAELLGDEIEMGNVIITNGEAQIRPGYEPLAARKARAILARFDADQPTMPRRPATLARPRKRPEDKRD